MKSQKALWMRSASVRVAGVLALAVSAATGGVAAAQDQATDDANVDTIVITARKSVDTPAIKLKQTSDAIVDSVTATDIAKTGDLNLPEALDRVVGVSSDSFYGTTEGGYISIRGFDSRYNSIDVDGNPILFSSQNNRGAQSGMFPSAIVNEVSVYKTVTADQDANSIGGHTSMRTLRAFDGGTQPYFKFGYRLGSYDQASRLYGGPSDQVYGAGKFTFGANHQYGFVFGFNRQRTANYDDFGAIGGYVQAAGMNGTYDQIASNVFTQSDYDKTVVNTAAFAKLETRIENKLYGFLSVNIFDEQRNMYLQRSGPFIANASGRTVTQTGDGTASFTNGQGQIREYDYDMQRNAQVIGAGLDYRLFDRASISLRGNYTNYSNDTLTRNLGAGFRLTTLNGTYGINGNTPVITANDTATYNDPTKWVFSNTANTSTSASYNRTQPLRDKISTLGAIFHYNDQSNAEGFGVSTGVNWVQLDRTFDQTVDYWALNNKVTLNLSQVVPAGSTMAGNQAALSNYDAFWAFMYAYGSKNTDQSLTTDYKLRETVSAFHATLYYKVGGLKLLAGERYERTEDTTDTGQVVSGVNKPLHREEDYGNWLPNLQAIYDATPHIKLRAAFTKTVGRPDFSDFAPGTTTTFNVNGIPVVQGSNGNLGPRRSTNYDTSAEAYFGDAFATLALYRKDIAGETFSQMTNVLNASGQLIEIDTMPLNTGSAHVTGTEITAGKRRLDFLPGPLKRLGISANYAQINGQWNVVFSDGSTRSVGALRNQPKWLSNLQLSYDAGPVDFNLNFRGRGRAFTGTFGTTAATDIWIRPTNQLDAQASWTVSKHLRLTLDAKNIGRSYTIQSTGIGDSLYNSVGNGRSYWLGLSYKY